MPGRATYLTHISVLISMKTPILSSLWKDGRNFVKLNKRLKGLKRSITEWHSRKREESMDPSGGFGCCMGFHAVQAYVRVVNGLLGLEM